MVDLKKDVWAVADTLRGVYARNKAGDVILPMTILRRLECVMAPHRDQVAAIIAQQPNETLRVKMIKSFTGGVKFYNTTKHTLASVYDSGDDMADNLLEYVRGFSQDIDVFANFHLPQHIERMRKGGILATIVRQFRDLDLSPKAVPNSKMGELFEHLIYMDFESSNAESGDHYTPVTRSTCLWTCCSPRTTTCCPGTPSAAFTTPPLAPAACSAWQRNTFTA